MKCLNTNGQVVEISQQDELWLDDMYFLSQQRKLSVDAPRAALAYRVSTKGQVDHDDIPMQKIACRKFAQEHGWSVVTEKAEKGISGSKVSAKKRDVIQQLKAGATNGEFDILLVYMFDRLGRIESETPFVLEWFVKNGIEMWSTHEGQQKIESHGDKLMNYIRFWQAAGESEKTSIRSRDRLRQIVSSGHYTGGSVAYGYRLVDKGRVNKRGKTVLDLEIDPVEGPVVQELFRKIVNEGYSCHRLAIWLNEQGLHTHGGAKFQANNVKRMVHHEGYTGYIITKGARSAYIPELKIIEPSVYEQAVEMVERARKSTIEKRNLPQSPDNDLLLAGNLYCACCGLRLSGFHQRDSYLQKNGTRVYYPRPKYFCYAKSQHIRDCTGQQIYKAQIVDDMVEKIAHELFEAFRAAPKDRLIEKEAAQKQKQFAEQERALQAKVQQAERTLERYDKELEKCMVGESVFEEETLARNIRRAEQIVREANAKLTEIRKCKKDQKGEAKKLQDFYSEFKGWVEEYDAAAVARKRVILSKLFSRVEVGTGYDVKVEINLSYKQFLDVCQQMSESSDVG